MQVADLIWMAGFFDGEGYIGQSVIVTNTHRPTLEWCARTFGGRVAPRRLRRGETKPAYVWTLSGGKARVFLARIAPWLKEKRAQAELARSRFVGLPRRRLTMEERWQKQLELAELKRLKWLAS